MLRRWVVPVVASLSVAACSAAPSEQGESQSASSISTAPITTMFTLTNNTATLWDGNPVNGVVVRLFDDGSGDTNWAVVDVSQQLITEVLAIPLAQRDAFYSAVVLKSPGGPDCNVQGQYSPPIPCDPNGGPSKCTIYCSPSLPPSSMQVYLWNTIATQVAPACVTKTQTNPCVPQTCGSSGCGVLDDGCGNTVTCPGSCTSGYECINNGCVKASCPRGFRWCGADGCVQGTVCP
jgi:hypothetical protein